MLDFARHHLIWPPWLDIVKHWTLREFYVFVNSSETASLIFTKLWWNVPMIVLFKICVGFCRAPFNMADMARHSLTLDPLGILRFCSHLLWFGNSNPDERSQAPGSLWYVYVCCSTYPIIKKSNGHINCQSNSGLCMILSHAYCDQSHCAFKKSTAMPE